ncbi:methyl-accepting chemotaxis protein [Legionella rowbothamii]|uniref:methyl-accepting chemotaxis protein n=1 Tax=Legionella rowbothamii TaxID=96229 RepID=UPI0010546323|nr:methyl-accepting chemotaxis protein [Legionella rowbothamii]
MSFLMDQEGERVDSAVTDKNNILKHNSGEMGDINHHFSDIRKVFSELISSVEAINKMVGVVRDLSGKTDLLALNASIEAARAGQEGRGFAIVAHEVARLAEKSQESIGKVELASDSLQEKVLLLSERLDDIQKLLNKII